MKLMVLGLITAIAMTASPVQNAVFFMAVLLIVAVKLNQAFSEQK
jgi:hypothetical protein